MSVIGEQIKKYRAQKKYTQEKLGSMIGVTTQAVSKWERGGTPDAEVLPQLADALGVSIDALFGREEQDIELILSKKLSKMSSEDAFRQACSYCWSFIVGLTGDENISENYLVPFQNRPANQSDRSLEFYAKIIRDGGIATMRTSNDFRYFFLMMRPQENNILSHFENEEAIRQVFALFADKKILKIFFYLYKVSNIPVTSSLISQETGLELNDVKRCMKTLCDKKIVHPMKIASIDGEIDSYIIRFEANVLPLLCYADEVAKECPFPTFGLCDREKPIF